MGIVLMSYFSELTKAMTMLGEQPNAIVMGQGVRCGGTSMHGTFDGVPDDKRLEMPVAEDLQMGMAIGMAINGMLPVCVYPRWNFLLCAVNQLVNHLDRLPLYSDGGYKPKVIIRVAAPSTYPFNPGPQHDDDFTEAFRMMLRTVRVMRLTKESDIAVEYRRALFREESTVLVEYTECYKSERANAA